MIIFGFVGFVFEVIGIDVVTVILGFILGPMIEHNLRRTLILSQGSLMGIVERPVSLILIVLTLVTLLTPFLKAKFNAISNRKAVRDSQ
jgi:putative tricarboxylic transport membrane protein